MCEERVIENVVKGGALLQVWSKDLLHELSYIEKNILTGWKLDWLSAMNMQLKKKGCKSVSGYTKNLLIHFLDVFDLERWMADDKCIEDDANRLQMDFFHSPGLSMSAVRPKSPTLMFMLASGG
jgi:hypothetical protein